MAKVRIARRKMSRKKKTAGIIAIVLVIALLMGGAFAWIDFSQSYLNRLRGGFNADVLLHDDFEPWENKDVYVENTGDIPLVVRVLFREYFQVGNQILVGKNPEDRNTWEIHKFNEPSWCAIDADGKVDGGCEHVSHEYFQWEMTGAQKIYLHGTSEQGNKDYEAMIIKIVTDLGLGDIPVPGDIESFLPYLDNPLVVGPNGQMFSKTAEQVFGQPDEEEEVYSETAIVTIEDWMYNYTYHAQRATPCWILDTDGWAYWSQLLPPGEATNLLLDNVDILKPPDDNYDYMIDVQLQAVNVSEWHKLTAGAYGLPVVTQEATDHIIKPILDEDENEIDITVNVANPIDVQLAVGMSGVDYKYFENDLRAVLAQKIPPIPADEVLITTGEKVSATNTTSEFSWWVYDHTRSSSAPYNGTANIDNSARKYIENDATSTKVTGSYGNNASGTAISPAVDPVNNTFPITSTSGYGYTPYADNPDIGQKAHPYTGNRLHMIESNGGATMDFYGYAQYAYKDFLYLPSADKAPKTFEFAIEEDLAFDALDGAGFFFNLEIYGGDYGAATNPQMMRGYLLLLTYSSGKGSEMSLYKFNNVNTKTFHHSNWTGTSGGTIASLSSGAMTFTKVASSNVYTSAHFSRKIKIEVTPNSVQAWYRGSTNSNDGAITNTSIPDDAQPIQWTMTANGTGQSSGTAQTTVNLDPGYVTSYGFGPMCSYIGHNCARPTHMTFKNLLMTMERPRSLLEVLENTEWEDNKQNYVIFLNEEINPDFESSEISGEILRLLQNDDIHYIGWDGNKNQEQSQEFLQKYNENSTLVNIDAMTHAQQIQAIADAIYDGYWNSDVGTTVLTKDKTLLDIIGDDPVPLSNAQWPRGKWKVVHRTDGFDNADGIHSLSEKYLLQLNIQFDKPGYYEIYYKDKLKETIIAHRPPEASFTVDLNGGNPIFTDTSRDPDNETSGIASTKWSYIDLDADSTFSSGKPNTLIAGHNYLVKLEVTDVHGETTATSQTICYP